MLKTNGILATDGLKAEKSNSYSISADYYITSEKVKSNIMVEGFYTKLDDVFVLEAVGQNQAGYLLIERRNGSGAIVTGANLEAKLAFSPRFQFQSGFTLQRSLYDEPEAWLDNEDLEPVRDMLRTPDLYGYFTIDTRLSKSLKTSITGIYTGSMLVPHFSGYVEIDRLVQTSEFFDLNVKISYDFKLTGDVSIQISSGIKNIFNSYQKDFDEGEYRDAGFIYEPSLPRSIFFGIKLGNI